MYTLLFTTVSTKGGALVHTLIHAHLSMFSSVVENLHDICLHQTAHPPVYAKKGKKVRFSEMAIERVLRGADT